MNKTKQIFKFFIVITFGIFTFNNLFQLFQTINNDSIQKKIFFNEESKLKQIKKLNLNTKSFGFLGKNNDIATYYLTQFMMSPIVVSNSTITKQYIIGNFHSLNKEEELRIIDLNILLKYI